MNYREISSKDHPKEEGVYFTNKGVSYFAPSGTHYEGGVMVDFSNRWFNSKQDFISGFPTTEIKWWLEKVPGAFLCKEIKGHELTENDLVLWKGQFIKFKSYNIEYYHNNIIGRETVFLIKLQP